MMSVGYSRSITATAIAGVFLSVYALYVEMAAHQPGYKALCDISERASCTKVLTSPFAKGFGLVEKDSSLEIPNCVYGVVFYNLMIFLATFDNVPVLRLQLSMAASSVAMSVYLAYLLAFVLYDFCIVCVSTYLVNILLFYFVYGKFNTLPLLKKTLKKSH